LLKMGTGDDLVVYSSSSRSRDTSWAGLDGSAAALPYLRLFSGHP
jgi:hypothetical protein